MKFFGTDVVFELCCTRNRSRIIISADDS